MTEVTVSSTSTPAPSPCSPPRKKARVEEEGTAGKFQFIFGKKNDKIGKNLKFLSPGQKYIEKNNSVPKYS